GELDRFTLRVGKLPERGLDPLALEAQPGDVLRRGLSAHGLAGLERLGAAAPPAANEGDGAPGGERGGPRTRLAALGEEARRAAPDREERVLNGVLRQRLVAYDAQREAVGDAPVAVVELRERDLVRAGRQGDNCFVGEVCEVTPQHRGRTGSG